MTKEEKCKQSLNDELIQLIDAELQDPVFGSLLGNRNALYALAKEIRLVLLDKACQWFSEIENGTTITNIEEFTNDFRKAMEQ